MDERPAFVCPFCETKSYNQNDIREAYCGRCHVFVGDLQSHDIDLVRRVLKDHPELAVKDAIDELKYHGGI